MPCSKSTILLSSLNSNPHINECLFEPFYDGFNDLREYDDIINEIEDKNLNKTIFIKEIVRYNPPSLTKDFFYHKTHTFLIRNPINVVKNYLHKCNLINHKIDYTKSLRFDLYYDFYRYITDTLNIKTYIIDSDELVENPELQLKNYCKFINIQFDPAMLIPDNLNIKTSCDSSSISDNHLYDNISLPHNAKIALDKGIEIYNIMKNILHNQSQLIHI